MARIVGPSISAEGREGPAARSPGERASAFSRWLELRHGTPGANPAGGPVDARGTVRATVGVEADDDAAPECVICGHRRCGPRRPHHLTHGIVVWVCATHGGTRYLSRNHGTDFVLRLTERWEAAGGLTRRRAAALRTHVLRAATPRPRPLPGSYSWPELRREAEQRFAAGEEPAAVITDLRTSHRFERAVPPSVRTMRRWFSEARWLAAPAGSRPPARVSQSRRRMPMSRYQRFVRIFGDPPDRLWRQALFPWLEGYEPIPRR